MSYARFAQQIAPLSHQSKTPIQKTHSKMICGKRYEWVSFPGTIVVYQKDYAPGIAMVIVDPDTRPWTGAVQHEYLEPIE